MDEFDAFSQSNQGTETTLDEFNTFNQTNQVTEKSDEQNTNNQDDDLFGGEFTDNTTATTSNNPFGNQQQQQQPDLSWALDDVETPYIASSTSPQPNIFDNNDLVSATPTKEFTDDIFSSQNNTNGYDSYPTPDLPPTADDLLYSNSGNQSSENNQSYDAFSNSVSSSSTTNYNQFQSDDNLSPLQAFNLRREQEIAEMDNIEKQKIEQLRQQGKKDLERWYEERRINMERKRQSMKQEENDAITQALEKSDKNTCDWAKVIRFLDFSQGTQLTKQKRDINRMRAVIIQAKRDKDGQNSENGV